MGSYMLMQSDPKNVDRRAAVAVYNHDRKSHGKAQVEAAAERSGWASKDEANKAGAKICNHYVPYAGIARCIESRLGGEVLEEAIGALQRDVQEVWSRATNYGERTKVERPSWLGPKHKEWSRAGVVSYVDDCIESVANDPANLFFWYGKDYQTGDHKGTQLDTPTKDMDPKDLKPGGTVSTTQAADLAKALAAYAAILKDKRLWP